MVKIGPLVLGSFGKYMKSGGFHEIQQISWNPADFMTDFMMDFMKSGGFHAKDFGSDEKDTAFSGSSSPFMYICIGFAEKYSKIHYSWNPADFMVKSGKFHKIRQISWWNPTDFIHEIRWISWLILKNANFFYNAYNFFFYVNQISNSLAMGSPRLSLWPGTISSS